MKTFYYTLNITIQAKDKDQVEEKIVNIEKLFSKIRDVDINDINEHFGDDD